MTTVWRLTLKRDNDRKVQQEALADALKNGRIAIGWGSLGNIKGYSTADELTQAVSENYPNNHRSNWRNGGNSLYDFCYCMKKGHLVILSGHGGRKVVMKVLGDYEFVEGQGNYPHHRKAQLVELDPNKLWEEVEGVMPGQNIHRTLVQCAKPFENKSRISV